MTEENDKEPEDKTSNAELSEAPPVKPEPTEYVLKYVDRNPLKHRNDEEDDK